MQPSKVRKGICAANLKTVLLWVHNYGTAQKADTKAKPHFCAKVRISALVGETGRDFLQVDFFVELFSKKSFRQNDNIEIKDN